MTLFAASKQYPQALSSQGGGLGRFWGEIPASVYFFFSFALRIKNGRKVS